MTQANRVRARLFQLIADASDDELFKINDTLAGAGHLDLNRCSKPGSPFPLFDLPLELLEHSAHYLSQHEAASILTVNRLFHDVFARVVWCWVSGEGIEDSKFQLSALSRYGHLVNQLQIDVDDLGVESIASLVPYTMPVYICDDQAGSNLQAGKLDLLHNLRTVDIIIPERNKVVLDLIRDWINNDSLNGHISVIELIFINIDEWMKDIMSFYNSIINKKRIKIKLHYIGRVSPKNLILGIAPSLIQLEILFCTCTSRYLDSIYRTSNATFPFVTELKLNPCCAGRHENSLLGLTPERFPSVRILHLNVDRKECVHQNGYPLPIILSHTWPSVTLLDLDDYINQRDNAYIASALPNLIIFDYDSGVDSYDMTDFLPEFKFLQVLILRDDYAAYNPGPSTFIMPNKIMSRLRSIELSHLELTAEIVRFIFYCCPSLVELKIGYCTISSDVVEYANEVSKNVNSAVRHLRLKGCFQAELDLWVEFISNFKNLKDILVNVDSDGVDYLEEKFTERFPSAKVIKYPG